MKIARDVALTLVLAIVIAPLGLYTLCVYNPFSFSCPDGAGKYVFVMLLIVLGVLVLLFIPQFKKTQSYFKKRTRSFPLPAEGLGKAVHTFENTVKGAVDILWNSYEPEQKDVVTKQVVIARRVRGWRVDYSSGYQLLVYESDFYYWLLRAVKKQKEWQDNGLINIKSPISQRESGLPRSKWLAYRRLLLDANALKQVNGNIICLKDWALYDPEQVLQHISSVRPIQEV